MNRYLSRKFLIAVVGLYAGANVLQKATTKEVAQ